MKLIDQSHVSWLWLLAFAVSAAFVKCLLNFKLLTLFVHLDYVYQYFFLCSFKRDHSLFVLQNHILLALGWQCSFSWCLQYNTWVLPCMSFSLSYLLWVEEISWSPRILADWRTISKIILFLIFSFVTVYLIFEK